MKYGLVKYLLGCLCLPAVVTAQNLLPNGGFEDINICSEYHAPCAAEGWFNVPATNHLVNSGFAATPKAGRMLLLLPVGSVLPTAKNQRFTYTMLLCPLTAGEEYEISCYINTARKPFRGMNIFLSTKEPDIFSFSRLDKNLAIVLTERDIVGGDLQWQLIRKKFRASGNEAYLILDNNPPIPQTYSMKDAMNKSGDIFYFIDEISLHPVITGALCNEQAENLKRLYAQNLRHTEGKIPAPAPLVVSKPPAFLRDTVTIPAVLFDVGSAALKPTVKKILDSLVTELAAGQLSKLEINGHTDNTGQLRSNEKLSEARAEAVKQYLMAQLPQFSDRIFSTGMGAQQPVADNKSSAGRSRNRRVELIITRLKPVRQ